MLQCPNCGRKTYYGNFCQWCHYPTIRHGFTRYARRKTRLNTLAQQSGRRTEQNSRNTKEKTEKEWEEELARITAEQIARAIREQAREEARKKARREAEQTIKKDVRKVPEEDQGELPAATAEPEETVAPSDQQSPPPQIDSLVGPSYQPDEPEKAQISAKIRVFIVDRDALFGQGLRQYLSRTDDIEVVGASQDFVADTVLMIEEPSANVVLVDIDPPSLSGCDLARQITEHWPAVPVVMLTPYDNDEQVLKTLKAGAAAYLTKDTTAQGLANTIRKVSRGERIISNLLTRPKIARQVLTHFQAVAETEEGLGTSLSPQERDILGYFANGHSSQQVAYTMAISQEAIEDTLTAIASGFRLIPH